MLELIKTRRSTRKFRPDPVPEELLAQIVEAGRYAPSGSNSQTTHFLVIKNPDVMEKLKELVKAGLARMEITEGMYRSIRAAILSARKEHYSFQYDAPVLILTANDKDYSNNLADCSCALENMLLMANALDLGSCWINQPRWLNEDPDLLAYLRTLGLHENERVWGSAAIGYADTADGLPERTPLPRTGNEVTVIE